MVMFKDPLQSCAWAGDAKFTARTTAAAAATSLSTSLMRDADISYASFEVFPNLLAAQRFGAYWHTAFPGAASKTFRAFSAAEGYVSAPHYTPARYLDTVGKGWCAEARRHDLPAMPAASHHLRPAPRVAF